MKIIRAIYRDGGLHPIEPLSLQEGTEVEVTLLEPNGASRVAEQFAGVAGAIAPDLLEEMRLSIQEKNRLENGPDARR